MAASKNNSQPAEFENKINSPVLFFSRQSEQPSFTLPNIFNAGSHSKTKGESPVYVFNFYIKVNVLLIGWLYIVRLFYRCMSKIKHKKPSA